MSKAVLISIRPKWVEKITSGEKTIEVRNTRPKLKTPFKAYIYCTQPKYPHEDFISTDYPKPQFYGGGKVIGEFTCEQFWVGTPRNTNPLFCMAACMDGFDTEKYAKGKMLYGWHISDLRIYDEPRELTEFRRACPNSWYCESCAMYWENNGTCGNEDLYIKRPPQSWCYVEEM